MAVNKVPSLWKALKQADSWTIQTDEGKVIAVIKNTGNDERFAKMIAATPYMLSALRSVSKIMGDEDLPDNGDLSGAAISDMVRAAVSLAE